MARFKSLKVDKEAELQRYKEYAETVGVSFKKDVKIIAEFLCQITVLS